ncbi:MAG: hypothetical protein M3285_00920 [Actinomycetota bacterium]|nr:hypothetical protein [Actinomycetota bacterium]MDQ3954098.1 hypothetical protein [Actinomycetota bacterium]
MRRLAAVAAAALSMTVLAAAPTAATLDRFELYSKPTNRPGAPVIFVLQNNTSDPQRFDSPWTITRAKTREVVAQYHWARAERRLSPGETAIWEWDQRKGARSSDPSPPEEADRAGPGGYILTIETPHETLTRRFQIGRFFTLGFEGRDASFVVFVNERKPIKLMKAEAEAEDKTLIVSGKVRGEQRYNRDWSYSMGPGSIVLGEVFVEVCDGSPGYVERHKKEWLGKRWCPWSSYVAAIGR